MEGAAAKQRTAEQLALSMLQQRMVEAHKRDSQMEDAERMAQQLIAEEEEIKAKDQDMEELKVMSHDAAHAKDVARADLSKLQAQCRAFFFNAS